MKLLILPILFSSYLSGFSQVKNVRLYKRADFHIDTVYTTPDTLRAELLLTYTTRRWGVAHSRDGYVVRKDGKVIRFLDDRKQRFPPNARLWGWIVNEEKVRP